MACLLSMDRASPRATSRASVPARGRLPGCLRTRRRPARAALVEARLAGDERPRPVFELLPETQEKLDERRVRRQVRTQSGQQTRLVPQGALVARAGLEDVDCLE